MRRRMFSIMLMALGLAALVLGFSAAPLASPATAAPLLQPSPRPPLPPPTEPPPPTTEPTVGPAPTNSPVPTNGPAPTDDPAEGGGGDSDDAAPLPGRITGTVIDRRTGAPASGIRVAIGEQVLATNSSGNYDIYLSPGGYVVSLVLSAGQGTPAQGPQEVSLDASAVVVVHLFFNSPLPLVPTVPPTAVPPSTATPVTTVAPPVAVLPDLPLPDTSVDALPTSLPVTAVSFNLGQAWIWMLMGSCLLGLGALVQLGGLKRKPRRRTRPRTGREG